MAQQTAGKSSVFNKSGMTAACACAAASSILILRTPSLSLGVLLLVWVLCGILIRLALSRRTPQPERS